MADFLVNDDLNFTSNSPFTSAEYAGIRGTIDYFLPQRNGRSQKVGYNDSITSINIFEKEYLSNLIENDRLTIDIQEL